MYTYIYICMYMHIYIYIHVHAAPRYIMLVCCWSFTSCQHLRSYGDMHQLVKMCTHGDLTKICPTGRPDRQN